MNDGSDTTNGFDQLGDREYIVTEVVKTSRPKGIQTGDWYRYTISHGSSPISGIRSGSPKSVWLYAEQFAENLNQRALLGYSAYASRRHPKK